MKKLEELEDKAIRALMSGDIHLSIAYFELALELNPDNEELKDKIECLEKAAEIEMDNLIDVIIKIKK